MARTQNFTFKQRLKWWFHKKQNTYVNFNDLHLTNYYFGNHALIYAQTLSMWGGFTKEVPKFR